MSQFYLRKVRVILKGSAGSKVINPGDSTDDQLQIEFSVSKTMSSTQNTASIDIWNLAEATRNAMGKEFDRIELEAGYISPDDVSTVGTIFIGELRDVEHTRERDDIITHFECGDGDAAVRRATISKTYRAGTPVKEVVEGLRAEFEKQGVTRGELKGLDDLPPFKRPYSMCGSCSREMDRLSRQHGFQWSLQNETFETVPADGHVGGMVLLTPDTGLIGVPTITDKGVKVGALLNPQIRPGRRVRIESHVLEMNSEGGVYRVASVTFSGNNRSGDFKASIEGEKIASGKVDKGVK
ncbi:phage protein [Aureimonas sp. Leaf460]|uniref:phage protein n=1 Tax=unclassified Aureimonas TaxID=2615206 RepID=UPI0006F54628|nr:hypothetical protein [Aureimonas sp. Leaf460]KQT52228.1 hypothetical protein ASG62_16350 [Aureimonas sp. Leaf427]KQT70538.1 hypothetical protein ASG54_21600 [Aureimonas sp. Leaf460]